MTLPTARLSAFLPYVMPYAPGCPRSVAESMLRLAVIEFCERTWTWKRTATITPTVNPFAVPLAPYTALARIESIHVTGQTEPLTPILVTELDPAVTGHPEHYAMTVHREVILWPFQETEIRVEMSLKPMNGDLYGTDAADPLHNAYNVVPPFLFADHLETIRCGALKRILLIPDEPFTNPESAGAHAGMFERGIADAQSNSARLKVNAPRRVPARFM